MKTEATKILSFTPQFKPASGSEKLATQSKTRSMMHTREQIFQMARKLPCYRDMFSGAESFSEAPVIDKQLLYNMVAQYLSEPAFRRGLYLSPTGGSSSSELLHFPTDIAENHFQREILSSYLKKAKILDKDSIVLNLFGSTMMYRSLEIINEFCELAGATTLPVSAHCPDQIAYNLARQFGANCIAGTSSRIIQFAKFLQDNKLEHPFPRLIFGGEPMPKSKEAFLRECLKTESFNAVFGSGEAGVFGIKLNDAGGSKYLCPPELIHIEVVDADENGFGTMVVTNLVRTRFPLVRYNTEDVVRLTKERFEDREMNVIEFRGRADRSFQIGGEYTMLSEFSKLFEGLLEFQISLSYDSNSKMDQVVFSLVAKEEPDDEYQTCLSNGIRKIINSDPSLFITIIEFVEMNKLRKSPHSHKVLKIIDERQA